MRILDEPVCRQNLRAQIWDTRFRCLHGQSLQQEQNPFDCFLRSSDTTVHARPAHRPCKSALALYQSLVFLETQCAANSHSGGTLFSGLTTELACITKHAMKNYGKHYWEVQMIDCKSCRPDKLTGLRDIKRKRVNAMCVGKRLTTQK